VQLLELGEAIAPPPVYAPELNDTFRRQVVVNTEILTSTTIESYFAAAVET